MTRNNLKKLVLATALALPATTFAMSDITTGAGSPLTASATMDFRIIIPKFVFLQVGSGTLMADGGVTDMVEFNVPVASVGTGAFAQTTPANVATRLIGNNGAISLTATTTGAMANGTGDTISFTTLTAVAGGATSFAHPVFVDGAASAPVVVPVTSGTKVTDRTGTWTFSYSNAAIVPSGTYGDIPARNSRVTYTASMP